MNLNQTDSFEVIQSARELDVYGKRGITLVRGEGAWLWDDWGRRYLDCIGGQGSANLGHAHPKVLNTLWEQANKLSICPGSFYNDAKALLLQALIEVAPKGLTRAFLNNSGTEAVEAALKFARITTGRQRFIAANRGFHGRTFGAMSATFKQTTACEPMVPGFQHVPFNKIEALSQAMDNDVAGVILELVQGEGGVFPADKKYIQAVRRLCDQHGALLIIDEIQTGFCRTGKMFACEHYDLQPDILCLAKSIAAGLPMGATLVNDRVQVQIGDHGSTFGGNPLVCAVSRTCIQVMKEESLADSAARKGDALVNALKAHLLPPVREIRHLGLMIGIALKTRVRPYLDALMEAGVLALPAGPTVLRLLPPLIISDEQLALLKETLVQVLMGVEKPLHDNAPDIFTPEPISFVALPN